ncbi:LETM1 domain-containing protein ylh47 [Thecaphora frezii]
MSSTNVAAYLRGRGMAWASGSLLAAARARPGVSAHARHADVLSIFVPSGGAAAAVPRPSPFSSWSLVSPHSLRHKPASLSLAQRRITRYHTTETQAESRDTPTSAPPPHASSAFKHAAAASGAFQGQSAGKPPAPPLAKRVLSDAAAELGASANQVAASQSALAEKQRDKPQTELEASKPQPSKAKQVWAKIKDEALHYWHGSKLLAKEVRISSRLLRRLLLGYSLTRREHRQLKRTMADLLRLIPFIPFVVIPAGELLLPLAIKIFPNMLPSTFESKFAAEEKRRGLIKVRLQMAKFLQETIREGGLQATDKVKTSEEFKEFFRKVRSTGEAPSDEDIIKVAKLFEDDLTLDNLSRPQLVSICRYMQINAFGTDNYLRYQIRHKLNRIRQDDIVIAAEGMQSMSLPELVSACQSRGIQTTNLSEERLRQELDQWIDLHVRQRISGILLILSKAFNYVAQGSNDSSKSHLKSLELTLSSLPDNLLNEAELNVNKEGATNKQRLEVLEQQEELIEDEAEQEQEEAAAREADKERKNAERARLAREEQEARALLPEAETSKEAPEDARMTNEQLMELGEALSILSAKSSVLKEREELAQLIEEVNSAEQQQAAQQGSDGAAAASADESGSEASSSSSSSSSRSMSKRIKSMLEKIDDQLEEYDRDVGSRMHIIEASPTGKISVDDLEQALRLIKHRPDDEVLEKLVDKLDVDHDGLVPLDDVLELARAETGLGIVRDETVKELHQQRTLLRDGSDLKPKKSDIVEE